MNSRRSVRVANCSGFYGDRLAAAREVVEGGPIDVLTGDYLAELTMLILWKARQKDPSAGYAKTFLTQMEQVLGTCLDRGIRIVSNAGGLNPAGLASRLAETAAGLGLSPKIAFVDGDDLADRVPELIASGHPMANLDTGQLLADACRRGAADAGAAGDLLIPTLLVGIEIGVEIAGKLVERRSVAAFAHEDAQAARAIIPRDDILDKMNAQVSRQLIDRMARDPEQLRGYINLMFIARHLERVGDHATNIAEDAVYAVAADIDPALVDHVRALRLVEVEFSGGRFNEVEGTEHEIPADLVLFAMGFTGPEQGPLVEQLGVELDGRGNIARDASFAARVVIATLASLL